MKSKSKSFKFKKQVRKVEDDIKETVKKVVEEPVVAEPQDECPCCEAGCTCCEHASGRVNYKCTCRCHSN